MKIALRVPVVVILVCAMLMAACASSAPQINQTLAAKLGAGEAEPEDADYRLQPGDLISVVFYSNPAMDQEVIVKPDGNISLFLLGNVQAEGKTLSELEDAVKELYSQRMTEPELRLTMTRFLGDHIYVGGEVQKPGTYPVTTDLTVLQAILMAGGFTDKAKLNKVYLYREQADGSYSKYEIDVKAIVEGKPGHLDIPLKRRDSIFVNRSNIARVDMFVDQYINKLVPAPVVSILTFFLLWERIKD